MINHADIFVNSAKTNRWLGAAILFSLIFSAYIAVEAKKLTESVEALSNTANTGNAEDNVYKEGKR